MKRALMILCLTVAAGCDRPDPNEVGVAVATLTQVPSNVACLQLTVSGSRTVVKAFDVVAGQGSVLQLASLPVGSDLFTGAAYATACASLAGQVPTWTSEPTTAVITPGGVTSVALVLRPSGSASVGVDFQDDGGVPLDLSSAPADLSTAAVDLACTPKTTTQACAGATCGTVSNGCGGSIVCGTCPYGSFCDGYSCASICECGGAYPKCLICP